MSGPIVRRYGFPNFEKIFGERDLKHGAEAEASTIPKTQSPEIPEKPAEVAEPIKTEPEPPKP